MNNLQGEKAKTIGELLLIASEGERANRSCCVFETLNYTYGEIARKALSIAKML
jgi:hypothetical protein